MCNLRPHTLTKVTTMGQPDIKLIFFNQKFLKIQNFHNSKNSQKSKSFQKSKYLKKSKIKNPKK